MPIRKIGIVSRTYRHISRYRKILSVLFRYGFGDLVDILKVEQYLEIGLQMISRKRREQIETLTRAERVRMALEELGPTFIKMGQILSTRPDLIPMEFIRELEKLQDNVPPFPFSDVRRIIESELQAPLEEIFCRFDEHPLAAASIGQVHRARLKNGEEVVVKVRRPGISKIIEVDLEIMLHLATLMERHLESLEVYHPTRIVEEFARTLKKEIDYTIEAAHTERFAEQFIKDPTVYVPKVFREVTTERVLTLEYVNGVKASEIERLEKDGFDLKVIAARGAELIVKQVFDHGFFHADLHPGNIFILPDNVICYIDFGMMGSIDKKTQEDFVDLAYGIVRRDESKATDALLRLTRWEKEPEYRILEKDVANFVGQHFYRPLKELEMGKLLQQLLDLVSRHQLHFPPDLFLMLKALTTVEGLGRVLDPDFDMASKVTPFIWRIRLKRLHPGRVARDVVDSSTEMIHLLKEIPRELREILRQLKQGRIKMEFEHRGLQPMLSTHERISNRIVFAIVLASLVIGSSLIVLSDIPPKWQEIPVIGIVGFLAAGVMGFWLLISILRHGKM